MRLSLLAALAAFFVTPAFAVEYQCAPAGPVEAGLLKDHKEAPIMQGLSSTGHLAQIFATPDGKTWTLLFRTPDGLLCPVDTGEGWQPVPPKRLKGEPS